MVLFDEADALFRGIVEGIADGFKDLGSFEEPVEIAIIDGDLGVEIDTHLFRLFIGHFHDGRFFIS